MADARRKDEWERASALLALTFNLNRNAKDKARSPEDFSPFTMHQARKKPVLDTMSIKDMKDVFMGMFGQSRPNAGLVGGGTQPARASDFVR